MNAIRKILFRLGLVKLVWLRDFDGEVSLRILHRDGFGYYAYRILGSGAVRLNEDGTVDYSYVHDWKEYEEATR